MGHIAEFCPQKTQDANTENTTATAAAATTTINNNKQPNKEEQGPGQFPPMTNDPEGWTEVTRRKKSPKSRDSSPATISSVKTAKVPATETPRPTSEQSTTPAPTLESPTPAAPSKKKKKRKNNSRTFGDYSEFKEKEGEQRGLQKNVSRKPHLKTGPFSQAQPAAPLQPTPPLPSPPPPPQQDVQPPQQMDIPSPQQKSDPPKQTVTHELLSKKYRPYQIPPQDPNRPREPKQKALLAPHPFPL